LTFEHCGLAAKHSGVEFIATSDYIERSDNLFRWKALSHRVPKPLYHHEFKEKRRESTVMLRITIKVDNTGSIEHAFSAASPTKRTIASCVRLVQARKGVVYPAGIVRTGLFAGIIPVRKAEKRSLVGGGDAAAKRLKAALLVGMLTSVVCGPVQHVVQYSCKVRAENCLHGFLLDGGVVTPSLVDWRVYSDHCPLLAEDSRCRDAEEMCLFGFTSSGRNLSIGNYPDWEKFSTGCKGALEDID